jgi:hypothetical protein
MLKDRSDKNSVTRTFVERTPIRGYSPFYRTDETGTQFSGHSFIGKEREDTAHVVDQGLNV